MCFTCSVALFSIAIIVGGVRGDTYWDLKCGITSFSLFTKATNTTKWIGQLVDIGDDNAMYDKIFLDSYPGQRLNYIANSNEACLGPIRCVKLKYGDWINKERVKPYSLYPDVTSGRRPKQTGFQYLEAWTYTDEECTKEESGYAKLNLMLVTKSTDRVIGGPLTAVFVGTKSRFASQLERQAVVDKSCEFLFDVYNYGGFVFRSGLEASNFTCTATEVTDSSLPLKIKYSVSVTVRVLPEWSIWGNSFLPDNALATDLLSRVLLGLEPKGLGDDMKFLDFVKQQIPSTNPVQATTRIRML